MATIPGVQLRAATSDDLPAIYQLLELNDMPGQVEAQGCVVAEKLDQVVGFARLEFGGGVAYIRPIVVTPAGQGLGVGRELVQYLLLASPTLRVVARGYALPFYYRLGFRPFDWKQVYSPFAQECQSCPHRASCHPQPLEFRSDLSQMEIE